MRAELIPCSVILVVVLVLATGSPCLTRAQEGQATQDLKPLEEQRTDAYAAQLEAYLAKWLVEDYAQRAAHAWTRDYSSQEAFLVSVGRSACWTRASIITGTPSSWSVQDLPCSRR